VPLLPNLSLGPDMPRSGYPEHPSLETAQDRSLHHEQPGIDHKLTEKTRPAGSRFEQKQRLNRPTPIIHPLSSELLKSLILRLPHFSL